MRSFPLTNMRLLLIGVHTPISLHCAHRSAIDVVLWGGITLVVEVGFVAYEEVTLGWREHCNSYALVVEAHDWRRKNLPREESVSKNSYMSTATIIAGMLVSAAIAA